MTASPAERSLPTPSSAEDIPGWFFWLDRAMFAALLRAQADTPSGHLVELGAYLGKSAVVIGEHRRPGERFVVVDLFERTDLLGGQAGANLAESLKSYKTLTQEAFEHNYRSVRGELPEVVVGMSAQIVDHLEPASVRFMHIDASHLYDAVRGDIESAARLLRPGGLVVFDDFRSDHTPGVSAAVWEAVCTRGLLPVAVTSQKLYGVFSDPEPHRRAIEALIETDDRVWHEVQQIAGLPVYRLGASVTAKERDRRRRLAAEAAERRRAEQEVARRIAEARRQAVEDFRRSRGHGPHAAPATVLRRLRRRLARDFAPPALTRWVRARRRG